MKLKLAIILVNWERQDDTLECLDSIAKFLPDTNNYFVVLVDNGSKEGISKILNSEFVFDIKIIQNDSNLGFTGGNNIGIIEAKKYNPNLIMLLNNDTTLVDNSIEKAVVCFENNLKLGVIGLINYYYDSPDIIWQAGFKLRMKDLKPFPIAPNVSNEPIEQVDFVPGSSMIIRNELLTETEVLDENYFAYWEDVDLCHFIKRKGYLVSFLNNSRILHKVKKSTNTNLHLYLSVRNQLYFLKKYSSTIKTFLHQIRIVAKYLIKYLIGKENRQIKIIYFAIKDFNMNKYKNFRINEFI
ncbi:MAG: glycosyltransferase family 2 protein [Melioribacteraceae bacterium]|nr:glycosyltransferase family 2 protein [Melioribacteraceae bacterium]MCF8263496.1 glycosyltransferase family 2 protein [Melioribacteraceae bacterium]MCF8296950.1 glycosyltransferase family 2 protein [Saprospiraceae bacterium]